ncbi:hypothetical protein HN643_04590 [Candidatus Falkowbacteria bacterium]|jgi:hypothetical protein|nr:hypothetical protein [Candidatus Falkowbacteria bacterium]MBT6574510.1 hypothetical protein [Candidatus Falkowbacteria bacterium]MBT7500918.1 hypothetical protein [Candidatus Falkowbacteria bacterium]
MNISHLDKAQVLAALYNNAKVQGQGALRADSDRMTEEEARGLLASGQTYFDYIKDRVMKVDLSGDDFNTRLFNRDNGENAAEEILSALS